MISYPQGDRPGSCDRRHSERNFQHRRMDGGQDVFVHVSALERSGIEGLSEAQTVGVVVVEGGPLSVQEAGRVGKLFIEDVAIIGGRLFVFVRDAGPISIDRR